MNAHSKPQLLFLAKQDNCKFWEQPEKQNSFSYGRKRFEVRKGEGTTIERDHSSENETSGSREEAAREQRSYAAADGEGDAIPESSR